MNTIDRIRAQAATAQQFAEAALAIDDTGSYQWYRGRATAFETAARMIELAAVPA